jgi:hypothetical protein
MARQRARAHSLVRSQAFLRTLAIKIVFDREGTVGNADNQNQYPNIVSNASRVSNNGYGAGLNGTGALIVQSCGADTK